MAHILIVDDEERMRHLLSIMLSRKGYRVDQAGDGVVFELDSSGLPLKRIYSSAGPVEVEETFSDWREVDGVRLPHKSVVTQGGKPAAESTIQEWKLNGGLKPEELSQKP